jgi:hypothetical protein
MAALGEALVEAALLGVHVLGGGIWVGVMVFSIFVLHPRAEIYFTSDADFEDFIFTVVHGARWKVGSGILAILVSGVGLALWPGHALSAEPLWTVLFALKLLLFAVAAGSFTYVSWILWPKRSFATPEELPAIKSQFMRVGVLMIAANVANMLAGIAAHVSRGV